MILQANRFRREPPLSSLCSATLIGIHATEVTITCSAAAVAMMFRMLDGTVLALATSPAESNSHNSSPDVSSGQPRLLGVGIRFHGGSCRPEGRNIRDKPLGVNLSRDDVDRSINKMRQRW